MLKEKERLTYLLELLNCFYENNLKIEEINSKYIVYVNEKVLKEEDVESFFKKSIEIKGLNSKKEIYDHVLKLSKLYLNCANRKNHKMILKEYIPSIEKIASYFFDASKYSTDEHMLDDFNVKDITYDKLLLIFPKMIENLKQNKLTEKKEELKNIFKEAKTFEDIYKKIDYLILNETAYLEALKRVYPNYENLFNFYKFTKDKFNKDDHIINNDYNHVYIIFLNKTLELKLKEILTKKQEYNELLNKYESLDKKKKVLEIEPFFPSIKKIAKNLETENKYYEERIKKDEDNLTKIENEINKEIEALEKLEEKNKISKLFKRNKISELKNSLEKLNKEKETYLMKLKELGETKEKIETKLSKNEKHLQTLCKLDITIKDYEENLDMYKKENLDINDLKRNLSILKEELDKFNIDALETELEKICALHGLNYSKKEDVINTL